MNYLIFDIETGPLPEEEIRAQLPDFDPAEVKLGNVKDPEKRAAKIQEAKENYYTSAYEKAALYAHSGQVLAIGWKYGADGVCFSTADREDGEAGLLTVFADLLALLQPHQHKAVGFNIFGFDLPFLWRRALKHNIARADVFSPWPNRFYDRNKFIDLMEEWTCGKREDRISLDRLARFLGIEGKDDDNPCTGKLFWRFYEDPEMRAHALKYLENDIRLTAEVAERILP